MTFVKLHQNGHEILVNMSTVSEVYRVHGSDKSTLYFNFTVGNSDQVSFTVDDSLDEIHAKANGW